MPLCGGRWPRLGARELGQRDRPDLLHDATIGVWRGRVSHDRLTVGIGCQRIGAELDEQVHHLRTIHDDGVMERQAVVLVAAQPAVERRGIGRNDPAGPRRARFIAIAEKM